MPDTTAAVQGPMEAPSPVTVQISEAERARLIEEIDRDVSQAEENIRRVHGENLSAERAQKLGAVISLLQAVSDARANGDAQAASGLAKKARLLAEDLLRR